MSEQIEPYEIRKNSQGRLMFESMLRLFIAVSVLCCLGSCGGGGGQSGPTASPPTGGSVVGAPTIQAQSAGFNLVAGDSATLYVNATGEGALTYQWYFNGQTIRGANQSTYALTNVVDSDGGVYWVVVSNSGGSTQGGLNLLIVSPKPSDVRIVRQPGSLTVAEGQPAIFLVQTSPDQGVTYQWFRNGQLIAGATSSSYKIEKVARTDDQTVFTVRIKFGATEVTSASATLRVSATGASSNDDLSFVAPQSTIWFSDPEPAGKSTITVHVQRLDAKKIAITPEGTGCGSLAPIGKFGSELVVSGTTGQDGSCIVVAEIQLTDGSIGRFSSEFSVRPLAVNGQGVQFVQGVYFPVGTFAGQTSTSATITNLTASQLVVNGGSGQFVVKATGSAEPRAVVRIAGVPGYYMVNGVREDGGAYRFNWTVGQRFLDQSTSTSIRQLSVQIFDSAGDLTPAKATDVTFQRVAAGSLQVSLTFDQLDDVDLHLVTPAGSEIYYGNKSANGGQLDLDSNASCRIDGKNNENIGWQTNFPPPEGEYIVRVDFYRSCSGRPVNYAIRVTNCGSSVEYKGAFNPSDADSGHAGAGREVARIKYQSCGQTNVGGRVTVDRYVRDQASGGLATKVAALARATIELRRAGTGDLVATTFTDDNGDYQATLPNLPAAGPVFARVIASQNDELGQQSVGKSDGSLYFVDSAAVTPASGDSLNVYIAKAKANHGAFAIFALAVEGSRFFKGNFDRSVVDLSWEWPNSLQGGSDCPRSCADGTHKIRIAGGQVDDSRSDSVLAHEFGHHVIFNLSAQSDFRGPGHDVNHAVAPRLAWSEGAATFIGQMVLGSSLGIRFESNRVTSRSDAEELGTFTPIVESHSSDLSEATVTAILWDLADSASDSSPNGADRINNPVLVFKILKQLGSYTQDRGGEGKDLVDFLDLWLCSGYRTWEARPENDVYALVNGLNRFPYDARNKPACPASQP